MTLDTNMKIEVEMMIVLDQPFYFPDLAPWDFFLFPKLKLKLKRRCLATIDDTKTNWSIALQGISKITFEDCFMKWRHRWEEYFEGNKNQ